MPRTKKITTKEIETQTIKEEEEDNEEVILAQQCNPMKFECPVCKKFLEMQNEMVIKKKGGCSCKYSPFSFKLSKTDKNLTIDKKENGDISLPWGSDIEKIQSLYWKQIKFNIIRLAQRLEIQYHDQSWYWFDIDLVLILILVW